MNKKLKLTRLTVANLERVKGGKTLCACLYPPPGGCHEGANIRDGGVHTAIKTACS